MKPRAAPSHWPYAEHRTMAEVMADEERERLARKDRYDRTHKSWRTARG